MHLSMSVRDRRTWGIPIENPKRPSLVGVPIALKMSFQELRRSGPHAPVIGMERALIIFKIPREIYRIRQPEESIPDSNWVMLKSLRKGERYVTIFFSIESDNEDPPATLGDAEILSIQHAFLDDEAGFFKEFL